MTLDASYASLAAGVRDMLDQPHRYRHCVRVARLADRLAQRHGVDPRAARLAGMLHDLARLWDHERLLAECERRAMPIDPFERANPIVLHARLGAELARERFGIDDDAVLSAIRKHTLADVSMSDLDAVVYLADGLEPGRDYPERASLEALAFRNLDAAMLAVLRSTTGYLARKGLSVAPQTERALAAYASSSRAESSEEETAFCPT